MIGIVTALEKEYMAMDVMLDQAGDHTVAGMGAGRRYRLGHIPASEGGQHDVVLALADIGNNLAAIRASKMLQHFPSMKHVVMVGIAGGVPHVAKPDDHVRLGDVVVSDKYGVVQYDFDKETYDYERDIPVIAPRPAPRPPSALLLEAVRLLRASEWRGERAWLAFVERGAPLPNGTRPPDDLDKLYDVRDPGQLLQHPADQQRTPGQPRVFSGPIASANKLLKNPVMRDRLRDQFGVKAVEMEGSGIADATWEHEVGYLVVRGICDYCDTHKNDVWQGYAAVAAAAYTRGLIASLPAEEEAQPTSSNGVRSGKLNTVAGNAVDQSQQGDIYHVQIDHAENLAIGSGARVNVNPRPPASTPQAERASLQRQLDEARTNLKLIQERKAEYVLEVDVPLQLIKEERRLKETIGKLEDNLKLK